MLLIFDRIIELLYPKRCVVCDEIIPFGTQYICNECNNRIIYIKEPYCLKCGKAVHNDEEYCLDCKNRKHLFNQGMAIFDYASISDSLFRFKNKGRCEYAKFYALQIMLRRGRWIKSIDPECIIPVPIHKSRLRMRGYNQAEEIAKELSKLSKIPVNSKLICRKKKTNPLKKLNINERHINLNNAFEVHKENAGINKVLIIDDIYTTGSTIDAMAKELRKAGILEVYFVTVTIGRGI